MSADALRSSLIPFVAAAVLFVSSAHPARSQDGKTGGQPSTIVFICEHGSSRSFVAASLFDRIAEQRGLAVRALSRAVSPETSHIEELLRGVSATPGAAGESESKP